MAFPAICILLATIDSVCCNNVSKMLKLCTYEVIYSGVEPLDALTAVCEEKTRLRIGLTNFNRINAQVARDVLYHMQHKIHLHTYFMTPDNQRFELLGQTNNEEIVVYIINSFNQNSLPMFWRISRITSDEVSKAIAMTSQIIDCWNRNEGTSSSAVGSSSATSTIISPSALASSSSSSTMVEEGGSGDASGKKDRIIWTDELERIFLKAIHSQDPKKITPSKVVELMKVPGFNRKNIGSHLQKYRLRIKKKDTKASEPTNQIPSYIMGSACTNFEALSGTYFGFRFTGTPTSYIGLFPPAPLENPLPVASERVHDQRRLDNFSWEDPLFFLDEENTRPETSQVNEATTSEPMHDQQLAIPSVDNVQPSSQVATEESEDFLQMVDNLFTDDRPPSPLN